MEKFTCKLANSADVTFRPTATATVTVIVTDVDCVKYLINSDKISVAGELRPAIKKYLTVKIQDY